MRLKAALLTVSLAALLAACGGSSATPTPIPATPAPATSEPAADASEPASEPAGETEADDADETDEATPPPGTLAPEASPAAAAKVSANTASTAELVAALEAAGVPNADKWADEIEEYRPYDATDTALTKLRGELEKYNPGEDVLDAILSVLQP